MQRHIILIEAMIAGTISVSSDTPVSLDNCDTDTGPGGIIFWIIASLNSSEYRFCTMISQFAQ